MRLSIVTTMYQSAPFLREFYSRASAAARQMTPDYEIIFVNDGSPDESLDIAVELHHTEPKVRVVDLSRNFGHHKAMMTGLERARGELVFLIDCDLEEAPELLSTFVDEMKKASADVVYGVQRKRKGGLIERTTGAMFYRMFDILSDYQVPRNLVTLRLMSRRYVQSLTEHREREVFMAGLWAITGFKQIGTPVDKGSRSVTTYTFRRKVSALVNAVTSFSSAPLRYIFYLGSLVMAASGTAALYLIFHVFFLGKFLPGWASVMVSVWLLGGMMIFCIGIVGIYLAKVFSETKQRPYTTIRQIYEAADTCPASTSK
jgi:putative glycosyltransferase